MVWLIEWRDATQVVPFAARTDRGGTTYHWHHLPLFGK